MKARSLLIGGGLLVGTLAVGNAHHPGSSGQTIADATQSGVDLLTGAGVVAGGAIRAVAPVVQAAGDVAGPAIGRLAAGAASPNPTTVTAAGDDTAGVSAGTKP